MFSINEKTKCIYPYIKFNKGKEYKIEKKEIEEFYKAYENKYFSDLNLKNMSEEDINKFNKNENLMIFKADIPEKDIAIIIEKKF